MIKIQQASASRAAELSALALRSKGYWGYDQTFLEACRAELTFSAADCTSGDRFLAVVNEVAVGLVLVRGSGPTGELAALFVDPPWIGTGVGRSLLQHARDLARRRGIVRLQLDADPGAESFYLRHGAERIGESPSGSIPGRSLPRLQFMINTSP
ncbi:MAG: GNAT family N-acetyltransferase [Propionibacteriales bacterium]|nr:GNAT family N-acetyltransferase [Propionibacteriales bacterium]